MKVLCTHNTKPGRLPRLLTYFILQAAEFIRPHRMHRIDAAYCCTCPTFRDPCLCACWTPECVVQKRINRSSAGLLTGGDSLGPMEACITRGVQKYLNSTSLHSADMRCWNRFNQEGIQVLFPSFWLYIPTGRNWDPWLPQRICSKLFKWGGSPVDLLIWRFTRDLISVPAPLNAHTALQLCSDYGLLLLLWRRPAPLATGDICL